MVGMKWRWLSLAGWQRVALISSALPSVRSFSIVESICVAGTVMPARVCVRGKVVLSHVGGLALVVTHASRCAMMEIVLALVNNWCLRHASVEL